MGGRYKGGTVNGLGFPGRFSLEYLEFWLNDSRVLTLKTIDRYTLFILGLLAIHERREVLPKHTDWSQVGRKVVTGRSQVGRDMARVGHRLVEKGLIDETADGCIIVCGAMKRTPNLKWKDEGDIVGIHGYSNRKRDRFRATKEKKKETRAREPLGAVSRPPEKDPRATAPDWTELAREKFAKSAETAKAAEAAP